MTRLDDNLAALAGRDPDLARRLRAESGAGIQVVRGRGGPNLFDTLKRLFYHSETDPLGAAKDLVARVPPAGMHLALGLGLGYHLLLLHQRDPGTPLVIVEPRPAAALRALETADLCPLWRRPEVRLIVETDPDRAAARVVQISDLDRLERPAFVELDGAAQLYGDYVKRFRARLAERVQAEQRTRLTLLKFARAWQEHFWASFTDILKLPSVRTLDGAATGRPGFIIGGGPTLDEALPHLVRARGRALLLAVDTAVPSLLDAGVEPDLVITLDAGWGNARSLLERVTAAHLVAFPLVVPEVLHAYAGRTFAFNLRHPALRFLDRVREPIDELRVSGSVATAAYDLAGRLGCEPIVFVGVDLWLNGEMVYTRGAALYRRWRSALSRLTTCEMKNRAARRGLDFRPESRDVTRQMDYWRFWLEREAQAAARLRGQTTLNASFLGEGIPGVKRIALETIVRKHLPTGQNDWGAEFTRRCRPVAAVPGHAVWRQLAAELERAETELYKTTDAQGGARVAAGTGSSIAVTDPEELGRTLPLLAELCQWELKVARWQSHPAATAQSLAGTLAAIRGGLARLEATG